MLFERGRDADWMIEDRQFVHALGFGGLDAPLHIPHGLEIFADLGPVARTEPSLEAINALQYRIKNAALLLDLSTSRGWIGASIVTKKPFEDRARVVFHRKRCGWAMPRDCAAVRTTKPNLARRRRLRRFQAELERGQLSL